MREPRESDGLGELAEIARSVRVLALRTRKEAGGAFAGRYASAFRGSGMEFEESRPYAPGDDVRFLDWNALARTGVPWVKRFREERDQTLVVALDVSRSMRFEGGGRAKTRSAAHAVALLAAAAARAGDRVGLVSFDGQVRERVPPARGASHAWRVTRAAVADSPHGGSGTNIEAALEAVRELAPARAAVVLLSDFRDPVFDAGASRTLAQLAGRRDVVCAIVHDPREDALPRAGLVRIVDPERPGRPALLDTSSRSVRERYAQAAAERRTRLERALRVAGSDVLWLRSDRDVLRSLVRFFDQRTRSSAAARPAA